MPVPGDHEMLVKVIACGICGSDIAEWYRLPRAPLVPGHELGAEVTMVGKSVSGFKPGDRVFVAPKVACGECYYCKQGQDPVCATIKERLPGGFAEYVLIPAALVQTGTYLLPDHMTCDQSTFIEPLACVVRAQRLAGLQKDRTMLVMGCGMSGLLHIRLAKTLHCDIIASDINKERLKLAQKSGAGRIIDASENTADLPAARNRKKADVVMLCTSSLAAVEQAWQWVDKGGAVVFFAVPEPDKKVIVPINEFWTKEIRILTSYYCGPPDIAAAIEFISRGEIIVNDMITHTLPLHEIVNGYQLVAEGKTSLKVIIRPNQ